MSDAKTNAIDTINNTLVPRLNRYWSQRPPDFAKADTVLKIIIGTMNEHGIDVAEIGYDALASAVLRRRLQR